MRRFIFGLYDGVLGEDDTFARAPAGPAVVLGKNRF
jgi:hypothetical protein